MSVSPNNGRSCHSAHSLQKLFRCLKKKYSDLPYSYRHCDSNVPTIACSIASLSTRKPSAERDSLMPVSSTKTLVASIAFLPIILALRDQSKIAAKCRIKLEFHRTLQAIKKKRSQGLWRARHILSQMYIICDGLWQIRHKTWHNY